MPKTLTLFAAFSFLASALLAAPVRDRGEIPLREWRVPRLASPAPAPPSEGIENGVVVGSVSEGPIEAMAAVPSNDSRFITMVPCRLVDTRLNNAFSGSYYSAGESRSFTVPAGPCPGIPANASAYSLNFTVTNPASGGWITAWPTGATEPFVSTLNYLGGQTIANAAIVPAGTGGAITVKSVSSTHVIIDINGYFVEGPGILNFIYTGEFTGTPSGTASKLRDLGTFTKLSPDTVIRASWHSHVGTEHTGTNAPFCQFQLRIDNAVPNGFDTDSSGVVCRGDDQSVADSGLWYGLAAGSHTVSLWIRGRDATCTDNWGYFTRQVIIEEH